jgi:hypothetical protein
MALPKRSFISRSLVGLEKLIWFSFVVLLPEQFGSWLVGKVDYICRNHSNYESKTVIERHRKTSQRYTSRKQKVF